MTSDQATYTLRVIARIHTAFKSKFGIPRQSGLVPGLSAEIVFEPEYRTPDAVRGLEGYSHLWLIWQFSKAVREGGAWSPTVRPPRLGGNTRMGVFATRSPYRPNAIGLSSVELERITFEEVRGPVLHIRGADLLDGTPIFDIKPYLPFTDSHPNAVGGFADAKKDYALTVEFPGPLLAQIAPADREVITAILSEDPRPSYQDDPQRIYGMTYGAYEIRFTVCDGVLTVCEVLSAPPQ
ncbi:MAG: tRNA (N6-threonylcarbamoyladenosine(37)-N6)-methyltransferase TrmO [Clostridia bacterium]|nr:tRNA (N6-threonylcarbamoyladenosine(37)-N6)-methyltransferase TrmO [Clostridia bacterium]